jgi:hypothetical protein
MFKNREDFIRYASGYKGQVSIRDQPAAQYRPV